MDNSIPSFEKFALDLVRVCLDVSAARRPRFASLLSHPFFEKKKDCGPSVAWRSSLDALQSSSSSPSDIKTVSVALKYMAWQEAGGSPLAELFHAQQLTPTPAICQLQHTPLELKLSSRRRSFVNGAPITSRHGRTPMIICSCASWIAQLEALAVRSSGLGGEGLPVSS